MPREDTTKHSSCPLLISGLLGTALGIAVLIGWYAHIESLVQGLHGPAASMQYNTALCFLLSGLGCLALCRRRVTLTTTLGLAICAIALATLTQYAFGINLYIDQLLLTDYLQAGTSHPGRMSPNAALAFLIFACVLLLEAHHGAKPYRAVLIASLSMIIVSLGLVAILGYAAGIETTLGWGRFTRMSTHTAAGFIILGLGGTAHVWARSPSVAYGLPSWSPATLFVALLAVGVLLWQAVLHHEENTIKRETKRAATSIQKGVASRIKSHCQALSRMAKRQAINATLSHEAWENDAQRYLADTPEYRAIEWIAPTYHVRWIVPLEGNEAAQGLDLSFETNRQAALVEAQEQRHIVITPPIDLVQGGKGLRIIAPIYSGDHFGGFFAAVFHCDQMLDEILNSYVDNPYYSVVIDDANSTVFKNEFHLKSRYTHWAQHAQIDLPNTVWRVRVWPNESMVAEIRTLFPHVVLVNVLLGSVLFTLTLHFMLVSSARADKLETANRRMALETAAHTQTEQRFQLVVESSPSGVVMADSEGKILLVNKETENQFGYTRDELVGQPVDMLVPTRFRDEHPAHRNAYMANPTTRAMGMGRELFGLRKDGTEFPVEIALNPIQTPQGTAVLTTVVDITERKRAEEQFQLVVESSPSGVVMADNQGKIILVNKETENLFGYTRDELIGQSVDMLVPTRFRNEHPAHRQGYMADPTPRPMGSGRDLYGLRKDGSEFLVEIALNPIQTPQGMAVLTTVVDITERKRSENELKSSAERLQASNREMEGFVYTVSHDLKSPLVTFAGYLSHLNKDVEAGRIDRLPQFVGYLNKAAQHMQSIINDLLEISRIGRVSNTSEAVDVNALVATIVDELKPQLEAAQAEVKVQADMPTIQTDRTRLSQVFQNLLTNALKYGRPADGRAGQITVGGVIEGGETRYFVADNGPGIDKKYHERIFGLFQRLQSNKDGTGVGLAIVSRIAEVNDGRAWVESEPGQGAKFWIAFPSQMGQQQTSTAAA